MSARSREAEEDDRSDVIAGHHPGQHLAWAPVSVRQREVGRNATGADVRAADAVLAQLVVECTREADLAELRRAVDGLPGKAAPPRLRGDRDDVAFRARDEVGMQARIA